MTAAINAKGTASTVSVRMAFKMASRHCHTPRSRIEPRVVNRWGEIGPFSTGRRSDDSGMLVRDPLDSGAVRHRHAASECWTATRSFAKYATVV
jgi:hypothetical protein